MSQRAFWLIVGAYALLTLGAVVTLGLIQIQAASVDEVERNTDRIETGIGGLCEAMLVPDEREPQVLDRLSRGQYTPGSPGDPVRTPVCRRIVDRIHGD